MSLRLGALQDALISAGADPDKVNKAAEELANYDARLYSIDRDLTVLKWMVGTNVALTFVILGILFRLLARP